MNGFFKFVVRGNVIGLAVGVVIGTAFSGMVQNFVKAFLTPLIGLVTATAGDFSDKTLIIGAKKGVAHSGTEFPYGLFINSAIAFVLTAGALYFLVVMPVNKIAAELNPHHDLSKAKRSCPDCLQQIPAEARRCSYCTAHVTPITDEDSDKLIEETPGEISLSGGVAFKMPAGEAKAAEGAVAAKE
jgi:large conductance mechanosensitive channel